MIPRVPGSEAEQIVAILKQWGTPVWYLVAKDEGHGFQKKQNRIDASEAYLQFLNDQLR